MRKQQRSRLVRRRRVIRTHGWRHDLWDVPLMESLGFSGGVHLLILVVASTWVMENVGPVKRSGVKVSSYTRASVRSEFAETVEEGWQDQGSQDNVAELTITIAELEGLGARSSKPENDWPELLVPLPRQIPTRWGPARELVAMPVEESHASSGSNRAAGPGAENTPADVDIGKRARVSPRVQGACFGQVDGKYASSDCPGDRILTATEAAFLDVVRFWEGLDPSVTQRPGRVSLTWRIDRSGRAVDLEIFRDDVGQAEVIQWILGRVRTIQYGADLATGCKVVWHIGFGVNLHGMDVTLAEFQMRVMSDGILDVGEFIDLEALVYDDNRVSRAELSMLRAFEGGTKRKDIDVLWDDFLLKAEDDYRNRRVRSLETPPSMPPEEGSLDPHACNPPRPHALAATPRGTRGGCTCPA